MSVLHVPINRLDSQVAGHEQLLALLAMRRDLESRSSNPAASTAVAMTSVGLVA
jgi:hypothetical protein